MANKKTEVAKVKVSDVTSRAIYYAYMKNGGWFDGYSVEEIKTKADYFGIQLDFSGVRVGGIR